MVPGERTQSLQGVHEEAVPRVARAKQGGSLGKNEKLETENRIQILLAEA
jgi:hypothetical protein